MFISMAMTCNSMIPRTCFHCNKLRERGQHYIIHTMPVLFKPFPTVGTSLHHRAPLVPVECGPADTSETVKERQRCELTPRCPSGPGRKSNHSDVSLVDPASSHTLVSKIHEYLCETVQHNIKRC
jgi:hypothetical protein